MTAQTRGLSAHGRAAYVITVQTGLDEHWSRWFDDMTITVSDGAGPAVTTLTGIVTDQAALHGLLDQIRDLALPLLRVEFLGRRDG